MMHLYPKCLLVFAGLFLAFATNAQEVKLEHISTYSTGVFDESAAYDEAGQRIFFVNANDATVDVLDISDPTTPTLVNSIDLAAYGAGANSVAVKNGIVAIAVEADPKQDPGKVVFFDTEGNYLNDVPAGALPDMVTFTPDGQKVLVASEGEPDNDYVERMGGVMTYTISNPLAPYFVDYMNHRDFTVDAEDPAVGDLGVEDIVFIAADVSPTGEPLVVTSNEVSGSVSIFGMSDSPRPIGDRTGDLAINESPSIKGIYPNPFVSEIQITYELEKNGLVKVSLYDALGREAAVLFNGEQEKGIKTIQHNGLEKLPAGNYWLTVSVDGGIISTNNVLK